MRHQRTLSLRALREANADPEPTEDMRDYVAAVHGVGAEHPRPRTRGECPEARPCPFVSCRHHLYLDVKPTGSLRILDAELEDLADTCSLDAADRGPLSLDAVAARLGITKERARQIEAQALRSLAHAAHGDNHE